METNRTFTREEALHLPFYNYRKVDSSKEELESLARSMASQGQLVPIIVGQASVGLRKELPDLDALLINGNDYFVIGGERRTRAFLLMENLEDIKQPLTELKAVVRDDLDAATLFLIQMTENFDRKDSPFTEMGEAFFRSRERGVPLIELVKTVNWNADYSNPKHRLHFVQERIDYRLIDSSLWPALDAGLLYGAPGKTHQLYEVSKFPPHVQQALAKRFEEQPYRLGAKDLTGKLQANAEYGFKATWDLEDPKLGIKKFGTGACEGCKYRFSHKYEGVVAGGWKKLDTWICLHDQCFDQKKLKHEMATVKQVEKEGNFVYIGDDGTYYNYGEERVRNGAPHLERDKYRLAEEGSCPYCIKAVSLNLAESAGMPVTFICQSNNPCPVHWPEKKGKSEEKRAERKVQEVAKVQGTAAKEVRTSLHEKLMANITDKETAMHLFPTKMQGLFAEMLINATRFVANAMDYKLREIWLKMIGWDTKKHVTLWDEKSYRKVVLPGCELEAFIFANALYMPENAQNNEPYWVELAKAYGEDYAKLVKKRASDEVKEVKEKQERKDAERLLAEEAEKDCLRFMLVEVAWKQNTDFENPDFWENTFSDEDDMSKWIAANLKVPRYRTLPQGKRAAAAMGRYNELKAKFPGLELTDREKSLLGKLKSTQPAMNVVISGASGELLSKSFDEEVKGDSSRVVKTEISMASYKDNHFELPYASKDTVKRLEKTAKLLKVRLDRKDKLNFEVHQDGDVDTNTKENEPATTTKAKRPKKEPVPA